MFRIYFFEKSSGEFELVLGVRGPDLSIRNVKTLFAYIILRKKKMPLKWLSGHWKFSPRESPGKSFQNLLENISQNLLENISQNLLESAQALSKVCALKP